MAEPMTDEERERLTAELDKAGLLQAEYPDEMAARSCTCEPEAVCGAHRLLARYGQLFEALQRSNRERRQARAALRDIADGECENYTRPPYCRDERSGRTRDAKYAADRWCNTCIAHAGLRPAEGVAP